jgi:hypothetical protein
VSETEEPLPELPPLLPPLDVEELPELPPLLSFDPFEVEYDSVEQADEEIPASGTEAPAEEKSSVEPRCAGITLAGNPCAMPFPLWQSVNDETKLWCPNHKSQAEGEVWRWKPTDHGDAIDPERRCVGRLRTADQCPAVHTVSIEIDGEKFRVCSWHRRIFNDYGTLRPPSMHRKLRVEVDTEPDEEEGSEAASGEPGSSPGPNGPAPKTLRERVERSTEEAYSEIERALREALRGATKTRKVRCPSCSESFEVRLPDFSSAISASKLLLELVVSRPKPPEDEQPPEWPHDGDFGRLSERDLRRLAFPYEAETAGIEYAHRFEAVEPVTPEQQVSEEEQEREKLEQAFLDHAAQSQQSLDLLCRCLVALAGGFFKRLDLVLDQAEFARRWAGANEEG